MKDIERSEIIEISAYNLEVDNDEIVKARVKDHVTIDLKEAQEMIETLLKITPDCSRPLLVNLGKLTYITKPARDFFQNNNRKPAAPAVALIANSQITKFIGNFYISFNKPRIPTKLFSNEKNAVKWLKKFL